MKYLTFISLLNLIISFSHGGQRSSIMEKKKKKTHLPLWTLQIPLRLKWINRTTGSSAVLQHAAVLHFNGIIPAYECN